MHMSVLIDQHTNTTMTIYRRTYLQIQYIHQMVWFKTGITTEEKCISDEQEF